MMHATVLFCGVMFAPDAEVVRVVNVVPEDLKPLASLPRLRELRIDWTNPHESPRGLPFDLGPLAHLDHLEVIALAKMPVRDLTPLHGLVRLRELNVGGTQVRDLSPLTGLRELQVLALSWTRVHDLGPLRSAERLTKLNITQTQVEDLSPLAGLGALEELQMADTRVRDLGPLHHLRHLKRLDITNTPVAASAVAALRAANPGLEIVGAPSGKTRHKQ
ncbi:MAG TPA: hypothetical protein VGP64_01335 [Polyangia bacterium]|jgi:internalin A